MTSFTTIPVFRDGDLLSAAKLNAMLDNIDVAIGLDEQRIYPYDSGADVLLAPCSLLGRPQIASNSGSAVDLWLCHNGDRLVILHGGVEGSGTTASATVTYDPDGPGEQSAVVPANVAYNFNLSTSEFYQYQPVRVRIEDNSAAGNQLFVRYVVQRRISRPTMPALPDFTSGSASSAGDLNTILEATGIARENLNQPVPAILRVNTEANYGLHYRGWIQHRHGRFVADMTIELPPWEFPSPAERAWWKYNDVEIWSRDFPLPAGQASRHRFDGRIDVELDEGLEIGAWYPIEFRYERTADRDQRVKLWSFFEQPASSLATAGELTRWTHGDTAAGDDGLPTLNDMSAILNTLDDTLRWGNFPCREPGSYYLADSQVCEDGTPENVDDYWMFRIHRWLAYRNHQMRDGSYANAQVHWWTGDGRNTQSYTLPSVEDVPSFFDLDSTPIVPGMYMRISGVDFAIQTPSPGVDYA